MNTALEVLHCDNHVIAVRKPAGLPSVPDASGDESLLDCTRAWVEREFAKPGRAWLGVVHRLDRPVSGVVVLARTSKAAARLSAQWRDRATRKVYWGIGAGRAGAPEGEVVEWLLKDEAKNLVRSVPEGRPGALQARTEWRVLESVLDHTLYELRPLTGRPHQLRSCLRALATPLLGDLKYGAMEPLPDASIALHALEVEFQHPTRDERLTIRAAPPMSGPWCFDHVRRWPDTRGGRSRWEAG